MYYCEQRTSKWPECGFLFQRTARYRSGLGSGTIPAAFSVDNSCSIVQYPVREFGQTPNKILL